MSRPLTADPDAAARRIVTVARLFRLLDRRREFEQLDRDERIRRATSMDAGLSLLDMAAIAGAGERDQIAAIAVRVLSRPGAQVAGVLELLTALEPETLVAIWWALPEDRRDVFYRDNVCGYTVARYRDHLPAAQRELDELIDATSQTTDVTRDLARTMLPMGLDA